MIKMNRLEKLVLDNKIVNRTDMQKILSDYNSIPEDQKKIYLLRKKLKKIHPYMFSKDMIFENGTFISSEEQERKKKIIKYYNISREEIKKNMPKVDVLRREIRSIFPDCKHFFRIKEKIAHEDPSRSMTDIIGLRIVSTYSQTMFEIISRFENSFEEYISFKINLFAYENDKRKENISKNSSSYYQAIHYYIPIDKFFAEVQIRTPSIDIWTNIHHLTMYKPKIKIDQKSKEEIMEFGRIANIVDHHDMLNEISD